MMLSTHFCQASKTVLLTLGACEFAFEAFGNPRNPWQRTGHLCKLPSSIPRSRPEVMPNYTGHTTGHWDQVTNQTLHPGTDGLVED